MPGRARKSLIGVCFVLAVFWLRGARARVASLSATDSIEEEVCNTLYFRAACDEDEVIIVETAQYGRYQLGTCILEGFGYLGCMHDVMLEAESYCSGRRRCEIRVDDTSFPRAAPCHKDLKNHLWISYRCYKVVTPKSNCHPNGNPETIVDLTKLDQPETETFHPHQHGQGDATQNTRDRKSSRAATGSHLLSSWITEQTGCGTADSPWIVLAGEGQRINLTLYDFSPEATQPLIGQQPAQKHRIGQGKVGSNRTHLEHPVKPTCRVLATVRESPQFRSNTICSNQGRVVNVATSLTNRIELRFLIGAKRASDNGEVAILEEGKHPVEKAKYRIPSHFLFQVKVIGCATPPVVKGTRVNRMGDHVTIDCGSDAGSDSWQMTCVDGVWTGYYRNCSHDSTSLHSRLEGIMPYATSIVIVGIIAVLMVCFILTAGIFCIKWRLRQDMNGGNRFQGKPASRETDYGYQPATQPSDDRKYPLLPVGSYHPVVASSSSGGGGGGPDNNLNEYATMRLLQQTEQLMRSGSAAMVRATASGVQPSTQAASSDVVGSTTMVLAAENYHHHHHHRYLPPPPPPSSSLVANAVTAAAAAAGVGQTTSSKTGVMTSFLAASESPHFGYRSDHIYECPDLVRQEVSKMSAAAAVAAAAAAAAAAAPMSATPEAVEVGGRNFSL